MRVCVCARATACARNACGWGAPSTYFPATRAITLARIPSSIAAAPPARSLREAFASRDQVPCGHDPGTCWLPLRGRPRAAAAASPGDRSRRYCSGRQPPRPRVRQPKRRVRHAQVAGVSHRCLRRPGFSCGETQLPQRLTTLEARCYTLRTLPAAASSRLACPAAAFTDAWWRPACPERASR